MKKQKSKEMEIGEVVEWVRVFLKGEYVTGRKYDQLYRLAVILSQLGDIAKFIYHYKRYNPKARDVGSHADEVSIFGELLLHVISLMTLRRIDIFDALEAGMERLEAGDGYKKKGKITETKEITTFKGIRAAPGIVEGTAIVTRFATVEKIEKLLTNLKLKDKEKILVTDSLSADAVNIGFLRAIDIVAIVTDQGGDTSHGAILAKESKIPCVSGTEEATKIICSGDKVMVNGDEGEVVLKRRCENVIADNIN